MTTSDSPVRDYLRSADGLFLSAIVALTGLGAIACAATGHPIWMVVLATICVLMGMWLRYDIRRARMTSEERMRDDERQADSVQRAQARAREVKAQARSSKHAPPPAEIVAVPGAYFVRIREMRWKGIPRDMAMIDLICGACGYGSLGQGNWSMPRTLVAQFQTETGPGSGLASFNNTGATAQRNAAMQALTCPGCGSIDPGTWVKE